MQIEFLNYKDRTGEKLKLKVLSLAINICIVFHKDIRFYS